MNIEPEVRECAERITDGCIQGGAKLNRETVKWMERKLQVLLDSDRAKRAAEPMADTTKPDAGRTGKPEQEQLSAGTCADSYNIAGAIGIGTTLPKGAEPSLKKEQIKALLVAEVHPDDPPPSCHVCGAQMVPTRFHCLSCGADTDAAPTSKGGEGVDIRKEIDERWAVRDSAVPPPDDRKALEEALRTIAQMTVMESYDTGMVISSSAKEIAADALAAHARSAEKGERDGK